MVASYASGRANKPANNPVVTGSGLAFFLYFRVKGKT